MTVFCDVSVYLKYYCDILTTWDDQGTLKKISTEETATSMIYSQDSLLTH